MLQKPEKLSSQWCAADTFRLWLVAVSPATAAHASANFIIRNSCMHFSVELIVYGARNGIAFNDTKLRLWCVFRDPFVSEEQKKNPHFFLLNPSKSDFILVLFLRYSLCVPVCVCWRGKFSIWNENWMLMNSPMTALNVSIFP